MSAYIATYKFVCIHDPGIECLDLIIIINIFLGFYYYLFILFVGNYLTSLTCFSLDRDTPLAVIRQPAKGGSAEYQQDKTRHMLYLTDYNVLLIMDMGNLIIS